MLRVKGFTLIEVLIALAIVSIALTAIIKTVGESVRAMSHLQNKTLATYVAMQALNEARVGLLEVTSQVDAKTYLLGNEWRWQAVSENTSNEHIKKIVVSVFMHDKVFVQLDGYQYHGE